MIDTNKESEFVKIRINLAALQQKFHPCTLDFIRDTCQARCCRSTVDPSGIAVVVRPQEIIPLEALGAKIDHETGRIEAVNRRCPFQREDNHCCSLHGTPEKPAGCIISPFTVNKNNSLIVRNRYRMFPCFKAEGAIPVYLAHRGSLERLFGAKATEYLCERASVPGTQEVIHLLARASLVEALVHKNANSKQSK